MSIENKDEMKFLFNHNLIDLYKVINLTYKESKKKQIDNPLMVKKKVIMQIDAEQDMLLNISINFLGSILDVQTALVRHAD